MLLIALVLGGYAAWKIYKSEKDTEIVTAE